MATIKKVVAKKPLAKKQSGGVAKDPRKPGEKRSLTAAELMAMQKQNPEIKKAIVKKYKTSTPEGYKFGKTSMDTVAAANMGMPLKRFDVVKKNGVIVGNRKKPATSTKDPMDIMKKGGSTGRTIVKKQSGGATKKKETPFQEGVRKKDFSASDTNYVRSYNKSAHSSAPRPVNDKAPKTTKGRKNYNSKLDKAYTKTYGSSNITNVASSKRMSTGSWPTKESEYRVTPVSKKKMGGATKKK